MYFTPPTRPLVADHDEQHGLAAFFAFVKLAADLQSRRFNRLLTVDDIGPADGLAIG